MKKSKLLDEFRFCIRENRYSYSTEKTYVAWVEKFLKFLNNTNLSEISDKEIRSFLNHLKNVENSSASSRNQALNALSIFFKQFLGKSLEDFNIKYEKLERRLPLVLSHAEIISTLSHLRGVYHLMASLLYGSGLRLNECTILLVKDINFELNELKIYDIHRRHYHKSIIPKSIYKQLKRQIKKVRLKLEENLMVEDFTGVRILEEWKEITINDPKDLEWQFVFPSQKLYQNKVNHKFYQDHLHKSNLQKALKRAFEKSNTTKKASCQTLRHSFAAHLIEDGYDIHTVQKLLGHKNVRSTMWMSECSILNLEIQNGRSLHTHFHIVLSNISFVNFFLRIELLDCGI